MPLGVSVAVWTVRPAGAPLISESVALLRCSPLIVLPLPTVTTSLGLTLTVLFNVGAVPAATSVWLLTTRARALPCSVWVLRSGTFAFRFPAAPL